MFACLHIHEHEHIPCIRSHTPNTDKQRFQGCRWNQRGSLSLYALLSSTSLRYVCAFLSK